MSAPATHKIGNRGAGSRAIANTGPKSAGAAYAPAGRPSQLAKRSRCSRVRPAPSNCGRSNGQSGGWSTPVSVKSSCRREGAWACRMCARQKFTDRVSVSERTGVVGQLTDRPVVPDCPFLGVGRVRAPRSKAMHRRVCRHPSASTDAFVWSARVLTPSRGRHARSGRYGSTVQSSIVTTSSRPRPAMRPRTVTASPVRNVTACSGSLSWQRTWPKSQASLSKPSLT